MLSPLQVGRGQARQVPKRYLLISWQMGEFGLWPLSPEGAEADLLMDARCAANREVRGAESGLERGCVLE